MLLRTIVLVVAVFLTGCTSVGHLDSGVKVKSGKEGFFVLGMNPVDVRVAIFPGWIKDGIFHQNPLLRASYMGAADDGYIVGKAAVGATLAITAVTIVRNKGDIYGSDFFACGDAKTLTFTVHEGVNYITDVDFLYSKKKLDIELKGNISEARNYLSAHYANLETDLTQESYTILPTSAQCGGTWIIPVYIQK